MGEGEGVRQIILALAIGSSHFSFRLFARPANHASNFTIVSSCCVGGDFTVTVNRVAGFGCAGRTLLDLLRPLCSPVRFHALGLCLTCSGRPSALPLCCGRSCRRDRSTERILRCPATPLDGALECFDRAVEFVALCYKLRDDVISRHKG